VAIRVYLVPKAGDGTNAAPFHPKYIGQNGIAGPWRSKQTFF
jgi:hypothetical protein